jgi:esterase/lipase superfamily enzyme
MKFQAQQIAKDFLVVNAATTTVDRLRSVLAGRSAPWVVLQDGEKFFVFAAKEILASVLSSKGTQPLAAALSLNRIAPSVQIASVSARIERESASEPGTPSTRAVVIRRAKALSVISAIASLKRSPAKKPTPTVKKSNVARKPLGWGGGGHFVKRAPATKKAAVKKAPAKKAAPKRDRTRYIGPISFGFNERSAPAPAKPKRKARSYNLVDVFYATDREVSASNPSNSQVRYLNNLPEKRALQYGICCVTVPERHSLGRIESPSIWSFTITANPEKHFTISSCTKRSEATFFKDLSHRVGQTDEGSCFVFIHGYNVSFDDAVMRTAQLASDLKFLGTPILYSWASAANWRKYPKDVETVDMTVDSLTTFLEQIVAWAGAKTIHLIAHSMGNRALVKALKQMTVTGAAKPFKQVVLTAPDVPRQNVEPLIAAASTRAERVTLYASSKDKALGLSKVKNDYERLGKVYGFPFVLPGMDSIDASNVKTDFWEHTVFAKARTVLADLATLILDGHPPERRFGLKRVNSPHGLSWMIAP